MLPCLLLEVFVVEVQVDLFYRLWDERGVVNEFTELGADVGRDGVLEIAAEFAYSELVLTQVDLLLVVDVVDSRKEELHEIALLLDSIDFFLNCIQLLINLLKKQVFDARRHVDSLPLVVFQFYRGTFLLVMSFRHKIVELFDPFGDDSQDTWGFHKEDPVLDL